MILCNVAASGSRIGLGDALAMGLLGYAIVFIGLVMLMYVVLLVGKFMVMRQKKAGEGRAK